MKKCYCTEINKAEWENPLYHVLHKDSWCDPIDGYVKGQCSCVVCEKCLKDYKKWYKILSCELIYI